MRYFLYARKSEEDHKRQIESIPRQIKQLTERFPECDVGGVFSEETTAKKPGRPQFDEMVRRIRSGQADGILVWSINRLLRNPVDHGTVAWLLQTNALKSVRTMEKEYTPKDNVLILAVDAGVSTQFIKDLVEHTVAALNEKVEAGWFPHRAPEGYLNDTSKPQGQRDIIVDPVRFPLLRQAWDMMLTGSYTVTDALAFLNKSGYRVKPHGNSSSGRMSKSAIYRLFNNRFYAGFFIHNAQWHPGMHPPMVSESEFNRVQMLLGKGLKVKRERHTFAYAGLFRCGSCGCQICGERRYRRLKGGGVNVHTYFACSNGKHICSKKGVTEEEIERQLCEQLDGITVDPQYRGLLLKVWRRYFDERVRQEEQILESQHSAIEQKRKERNRLLDLRLQDIIDNDLFMEKKAQLDAEILRIEGDSRETGGAIDLKYQETENVLLFITEPKERFLELNVEDKRSVATHLGSQYILTEGKLAIELNKLLQPAAENARQFEADCTTFERTDFGSESMKKEAFDRLYSIWGARWNDIRTIAKRENLNFPCIVF